jgi:hypothetical protein
MGLDKKAVAKSASSVTTGSNAKESEPSTTISDGPTESGKEKMEFDVIERVIKETWENGEPELKAELITLRKAVYAEAKSLYHEQWDILLKKMYTLHDRWVDRVLKKLMLIGLKPATHPIPIDSCVVVFGETMWSHREENYGLYPPCSAYRGFVTFNDWNLYLIADVDSLNIYSKAGTQVSQKYVFRVNDDDAIWYEKHVTVPYRGVSYQGQSLQQRLKILKVREAMAESKKAKETNAK